MTNQQCWLCSEIANIR